MKSELWTCNNAQALSFKPLKHSNAAVLQQQMTDARVIDQCLRQAFSVLARVNSSSPQHTKHTVMQLCQAHLKA